MPTAEHWRDDKLQRQRDAQFLRAFLTGQFEKRRAAGKTAAFVLNINANWGQGKSFFLDRFAQDLMQEGHLVARVNAWSDDHAEDPYIAIMAAIDEVFEPLTKKPGPVSRAWNATKRGAGPIVLKVGTSMLKAVIKKHVGVSIDEIADIITDENSSGAEEPPGDLIEEGVKEATAEIEKLFDASMEAFIASFKKTDRAMADFRIKLAKSVLSISESKSPPLFILIDELDRCRPTYAVQLLERVKHLFNVDGVIFVFATNVDQLQHSINSAYGAGFNGDRYLNRFFDRTFALPEPDITNYIEQLCESLPPNKMRFPEGRLVETIASGCLSYGFDLRSIEQVLELMNTALTAWPHRLPAEISLLFPLCAHFFLTRQAAWPVEDEMMSKWVLPGPKVHEHDGRVKDQSIYFGTVYSRARMCFQDLRAIPDVNWGTDDISTRYLRGIFTAEWNGVMLADGQPSIQTELLSLVAHAGQISNIHE